MVLFAKHYRHRNVDQRLYPYDRDITYQSFLTLPLLLFGFSGVYKKNEHQKLFSHKHGSVTLLYVITLFKMTANLIVNLQLALDDSHDLTLTPLVLGAVYMGFVQGFLSLGIYFRGKLGSAVTRHGRYDSLDGSFLELSEPLLADDAKEGQDPAPPKPATVATAASSVQATNASKPRSDSSA